MTSETIPMTPIEALYKEARQHPLEQFCFSWVTMSLWKRTTVCPTQDVHCAAF
jgi:hypothetical protein